MRAAPAQGRRGLGGGEPGHSSKEWVGVGFVGGHLHPVVKNSKERMPTSSFLFLVVMASTLIAMASTVRSFLLLRNQACGAVGD